jgi:hypothetical protein
MLSRIVALLLCAVPLLAEAQAAMQPAAHALSPVPSAPLFSAISLVILVTVIALVTICAALHHRVLGFLSGAMGRMVRFHRERLLILVLSLFLLHMVEIMLFALGYDLLLDDPTYGALHGSASDTLLDYAYFSAVIFSTLGLGDLVPSGSIRFMVALEALLGFMLISWSAAFTYLEMEKIWKRN